ncbi:5-formyltetrahydrofolate cyclo-ligase [Maribacter sp. MMG018]|uniref:5-formyltetrahydrofolate cyclo-ligase n=1 Tax=Maribacter sp. MMG018 TaxID=2822688 RepID=UPI001B35C923|nr:5-formyltetrahydrofolate cyclo-ligase [Maribacter sp. MMG018]MBQ4913153.1 5-formyltetrahydrofolate cyclo-ligase [Maribacter sp. MMG018]
MLKKDLREKYALLRSELSFSELSSKSLSISNKALTLPIWSKEFYHIFLPIESKKEIDTINLLSVLQGKDKNIIVPKVHGDILKHYLLMDNTKFIKSKWGVPEPIDGITIDPIKIDVVFIPLLAFDEKGNRVGYGKGFYDTFLKECRDDVIKVGLSLFEAEKEISDVYENDIPLDYCVTPEKNYSFKTS